jgi:hypothetical protein
MASKAQVNAAGRTLRNAIAKEKKGLVAARRKASGARRRKINLRIRQLNRLSSDLSMIRLPYGLCQ